MELTKRMRDLTGIKFGRLTAVRLDSVRNRAVYWFCECECGGTRVTRMNSLTCGLTQSCGCLNRETSSAAGKANSRHGFSKTRTHNCWMNLRNRCTDANRKDYKNYGGKGIGYDPRWDNFECFLEDMGPMPEGMTLDRKDSTKNYCKENCRWATWKTQQNNRTNNRVFEYNGGKKTLAQLSEEFCIRPGVIHKRLERGWSLDEALKTKPLKNTESRNQRKFEYQGVMKSIPGIARLHGISRHTIYSRLGLGWSMEKILSTPIDEKKSNRKRQDAE